MMNTKREEERHRYTFSRPFRKHGLVPLVTNMRIYKKGDMVHINGMDTVQKGMPHKCYHGKTESLQCSPACCWHCCKQTRVRFLPRELMCILSTLSTLRAEIASWNVWRKMIRKRSQRGRYLGSSEAPACSTQRSALCESLWEGAWAAGTYSLWIHGIIGVNKIK